MAAHPIDMTGKKYGNSIAIRHVGKCSGRQYTWLFACDCGKEFVAVGCEVRRGSINECPSCAAQRKLNSVTTHGKTNSPEYAIWTAMKSRCHNQNTIHYADYGGRGIKVCDRWKNSFENFFFDMGCKPDGMTIDRINNDGDYDPKNCKWASRLDQSNNKRNNRIITINGESMTLSQWSKKCKVGESTIRKRLSYGKTDFDLIKPTGN